MDTLFLHGFTVETLIGVYEWERKQCQQLLLDLDIGTDFHISAHSDDIKDTIHYGELAETLRELLINQEFFLLEALAEYIAQFILSRYSIEWVKVKIVKPGILSGVEQVGVQIKRYKNKK